MVTRVAMIMPPQSQPVATPKPNTKNKPTCMFCKQPQTHNKPVFELSFKNMVSGHTTKEYYCKDCIDQLKKLVEHFSNTPELPEPSDNKYGEYFNTTLKDFLCTKMYLESEKEIIFVDKTNKEIKEFTMWLNQKIYNITDEDEYIKIVLN